ncbi:hypothetical protein J4Q44_G00089580 [Coregonus suidteri]|uniref:Uncharacterized protein n=1 Tax=Coregonus suidteri TaxID=861788 RepID=A0AAN8R0R5_9TELE
MWLSCSAFFQQFFHCYCPVGFRRRKDPSGGYIRSPGLCTHHPGRGRASPDRHILESPPHTLSAQCNTLKRGRPSEPQSTQKCTHSKHQHTIAAQGDHDQLQEQQQEQWEEQSEKQAVEQPVDLQWHTELAMWDDVC